MRSVLIEGGGIAGQVLQRELTLKGIPSRLMDRVAFPREKVCGGVLQADSWEYLNSIFRIPDGFKEVRAISHFWRGKKLSRFVLNKPMVFISRMTFDDALNRQQEKLLFNSGDCLRVTASGARHSRGEWIGFQGEGPPMDEIQMHYGRGIYLGVSPTACAKSHVALIVKKSIFENQDHLRSLIKKDLGVDLSETLKGTAGIHYHASSSEGLAVGDAKLATHPFLGLGMKHAILSARLLAGLIAEGAEDGYHALHKRMFRKIRWASRIGGWFYDSPFSFMLKPLLKNPSFYWGVYDALHRFKNTGNVA